MERESVQFPGEREGEGCMDERCYAHMCSAVDFQLFPEQHWPNLQQWWEIAIGTCTKVSFSGGPSRCPVPCSMAWQLSPAKCREILSQPKFGVKLNFECVSRYPHS